MREYSEIVKFKGYFSKCLYPKRGNLMLGIDDDHRYGITIWEVDSVISGEVDTELNKEVTVVGEFYEHPSQKALYTIAAKKITNPKYGTQYELIYLNQGIDFSNIEDFKLFLTQITTQNQRDALYEKFENPLEIIANHDIEALTSVKGIGPAYAAHIIAKYEEKKDDSDLFIRLNQYGLTPAMINKLKCSYGSNKRIIEVMEHNPYHIIFDIDGVGFKTADKIALNSGINPKSPQRISAFIYYLLSEELESGNSYVTALELNRAIIDFFGGKDRIFEEYFDENGNVTGNNIATAIQSLQDEGKLGIEDNENKSRRRVFLLESYKLEERIAWNLERLMAADGSRFDCPDFDQKLEDVEESQGFKFSPEQVDGIKLGLENNVCFISGLAGCGKSSLVKGLVDMLKDHTVAQTCLSGKAAARLAEITGIESCTIHKLLGWNPAISNFTYSLTNPLPYDIIILDEVSMVGGDIFLSLLNAIPSGSKLIMVGDTHQLESIGALNIATDMFNSPKIPTVSLTKIHRQNPGGIITVSHEVRKKCQVFSPEMLGVIPYGEEAQDMIFDLFRDGDGIRAKVLRWFDKAFNGKMVKRNISDIQIISPVKERGDNCTFNLNIDVQNYLIEQKLVKDDAGIPMGYLDHSYKLHTNDKVLCVKNNYHAKTVLGGETSIFNGWNGIVKKIDTTSEYVVVAFDLLEDEVMMSFNEARNHFVLGYACTCHKLQGSQAKVVIGVIDYSTPPQMLTCELLYTLITRAVKRCVVVGQNSAIRQAIATSYVSTKRTFLPELLDGKKVEWN